MRFRTSGIKRERRLVCLTRGFGLAGLPKQMRQINPRRRIGRVRGNRMAEHRPCGAGKAGAEQQRAEPGQSTRMRKVASKDIKIGLPRTLSLTCRIQAAGLGVKPIGVARQHRATMFAFDKDRVEGKWWKKFFFEKKNQKTFTSLG